MVSVFHFRWCVWCFPSGVRWFTCSSLAFFFVRRRSPSHVFLHTALALALTFFAEIMSNSITIDNTTTTTMTPKEVMYFGHKTAKPEHTFYDAETNERFLFLPPNIGHNPAAWNAFVNQPNYECSVCNINIFENALCSLHGLDKIDADQLHFYCNPECHKTRVALDLTFEEHTILVRDADGGIEVGQVLNAVAAACDVSPDTLSLGEFEHDDCIGQVLRSNARTIVARRVAAPQVAPDLEAFGPFQGTDQYSEDNIYLDELTNIKSTMVFGPVIDFLRRYFNDPDMPAILGNVNFGAFYVNRRTKSLHFFLAPGVQLVPRGDKYPLCKNMVRLLMSKRSEKYIQTDNTWAPWYHAIKSVKAADQGIFGSDHNALRKLLRQLPVRQVIDLVAEEAEDVAPVEKVEPVAPIPQEVSNFRQHSINAASGLRKITKAYRPDANKWFTGFEELVQHLDVLQVPRDELKPIHVVLEDHHIRLSSKVVLVPGTLEQKLAFLTQIAQWMTAKWTGKEWCKKNPALTDFKRVVGSGELHAWIETFGHAVEDPLWGLRQQVEAALQDASVAEDQDMMYRVVDIFGMARPEEDAEVELDLSLVNEQQLRQMLALVQDADSKPQVSNKPQTHDELKDLAQQTMDNTEAAIAALKNEMRAMSGKVVQGDHPVAQQNGISEAERYSLDPEILRKQLEAELAQDSDDDDDDSDSLSEEPIESLTRPREEHEEEEPSTKRNRVSTEGLELSPDQREALHGNVRSTYNALREMFPDEEDRQIRYNMIGHDAQSEVKW